MAILNTFLILGLMMVLGLFFAWLARLCKLPNVTGYLIAGLIVGPSVLGLVTTEQLEGLDIISELALGFIAFSVGGEFKMSYFKKVGATPIVIAFMEAFMAVLLVIIGLLIVGCSLPFSLVLGAIAAATAPAATIMVIRQYRAKGPVTDTLLSVVALDDAVALILFGIAVAVAGSLESTSSGSVVMTILSPVIELGGAVIIGFVMGILLKFPLRWLKVKSDRLIAAIAFVFLGVGIASALSLSSLLLCMAMGAALANFSSQSSETMDLVDSFTPPIFMLFFMVSGAELQLSILPSIGIVGAVYVVVRVIGKYVGALLGACICKADANIKKYLGPTLIPQAGVAIGLSLLATQVVPEYGSQIRAVVLCGTLIYELIGPAITKISLTKAGEIKPEA
jgi:Kef-type K+ transport system membrane component KefB